MTDFKHTHSDPHGSHRKKLHILLTHLTPRCALTNFPRSRRASSQTLESPHSKGPNKRNILKKEEGSQDKFEVEKSQEGQEYAPRLEPAALIRLADRNNAYYPSRHRTILKKRWLNDRLPAHMIRSTQESLEDVATYT